MPNTQKLRVDNMGGVEFPVKITRNSIWINGGSLDNMGKLDSYRAKHVSNRELTMFGRERTNCYLVRRTNTSRSSTDRCSRGSICGAMRSTVSIGADVQN
jgi:hypothetical protein